MSILFVLLMFLLILAVSYLRRPDEATLAARARPPQWAVPTPRMQREYGFEIPKGYCFHPGHTWVLDEGRENARVGLDSFAGNLFGKLDRIEVVGLNRWVRQGQKFMTATGGDVSVDLLSPVEGVITSVNPNVLRDPNLAVTDPYREGWICVVKSPEISTNLKNLVQGALVAPWMQNNLSRLGSMITQFAPATAQDGGIPLAGLLVHADPDLKQRILKEFFLV